MNKITKVQITDNLMLSDARNKQGFSRSFYVGSTSPAKQNKVGVYTPNPTDSKLQKYQWDLILNPESMVGWLQDEEEGEMKYLK